MKKTVIDFPIVLILACVGCENHSNTNKNVANISEEKRFDIFND